ncbi:TonB family protein [candidate division KSB1 bacterium]|nr:TonB family protein [candidate division KSB1 bacterium]
MPLIVSSADTWNMEMKLDYPNPAPIVTGKIYGKVTDEEGNPLFATNVILKGTKIGAAADESGNFYIINVPPEIYTLLASRMGSKTVQLNDVKVVAGESTEVNVKLEETVIDMTKGVTVEGAPPPPPSDDKEIVFVSYDSPPEPIGGFEAIQKNLRYPELARKAGIEGRVIIYVQVDENGDAIRTRVIQSLGENNGCDEAAIEAVKAVKWKPAMQRDQNVKVWIAVPIDFKLGSHSEHKVGMADSDPYAEEKIIACQHNQKSIESAASIGYANNALDGEAYFPNDISEMIEMGLLPAIPRCPNGGTYIYEPIKGTATCSIPGHAWNSSSTSDN